MENMPWALIHSLCTLLEDVYVVRYELSARKEVDLASRKLLLLDLKKRGGDGGAFEPK